MDTAAEILVIITSSVLVVFLIIAIILGIYLIKLSAEIRKVTKSAQTTIDHVETTVSGISKIISPVFVAERVGRIIKKYTKEEKK